MNAPNQSSDFAHSSGIDNLIRPRTVAILVHNDVVSDSRVRKQARSLVAAGHTVDVFGFSTNRRTYPSLIENGARLHICFDKKPRAMLRGVAKVTRALTLLKRIATRPMKRSLVSVTLLMSVLLNALLLSLVLDPIVLEVLALAAVVIGLVACFGCAMCILILRLDYFKDWVRVNWHYEAIARALSENVIGKGYDVVHCHDIIAMMAGDIIKNKQPDITMVWDAHELYTEQNYKTPYISKFIDAMIRKVAPNIDKMITISQSFADMYARRYPSLPQAEVVMNATRKPVSCQASRQLLRRSTGILGDQKILLYQGGFAHNRGIEHLLAAAPRLPGNWSVVFMGNGPLQDEIEACAAKANKARPSGAPCIVAIPAAPQDRLSDWTSGADLGIIPYENTSLNHLYCMPNKLWEYPNARVPILATDLIEINQIITGNGTGRLLPRAYSADDIVQAIRDISDQDLARWRENCDAFNAVENWEKFEPNLYRAYA